MTTTVNFFQLFTLANSGVESVHIEASPAHDILHAAFAMYRRTTHAAMRCSSLWVYETDMKPRRANNRDCRWITSDFQDENNEEESTSIKICLAVAHLRQFTQTLPENSKHFLPGGCETRIRLTDTGWQQHLDQYWFPFLLYLEKHGLQETLQQS